MTLEEIGLAWNSFFYDPIPVQTIAVFRICFGLLLLVDALNTFANAEPYLGPKGLLEYRRFFKQSHGRAFSLFVFFPPTMRSVYWILCLHFVGVTMMTVGLFTKVSTLLAFVTVRSIVTRSSALCNGGDNVANIMCFLLVFAPAGHAYSLDAVWFHAPQAPGTESLQHAPWALRLMQIQVSIIYLNTVYWKLKGTTWRNGTAVYYAATHSIYRKFSIPGLLLKKPCVQLLTWGVLVLEFALGAGLWVEDFRPWLVPMGFLLHLGADYMLNVHLFGWFMMASLLLFVDPLVFVGLFGG